MSAESDQPHFDASNYERPPPPVPAIMKTLTVRAKFKMTVALERELGPTFKYSNIEPELEVTAEGVSAEDLLAKVQASVEASVNAYIAKKKAP